MVIKVFRILPIIAFAILLSSCSPFLTSIPNVTCDSHSNDTTPTWSWDIPLGSKGFRYSLDQNTSNWIETGIDTTSFTNNEPLKDGKHTLYVQSKNSFNHWSQSGFKTIDISINSALSSVSIDGTLCGIDSSTSTILFPFSNFSSEEIVITFQPDCLKLKINNDLLEYGDNYTFKDTEMNSKVLIESIDTENNSQQYTLIFTELPILQFHTDNIIVDEPKVYSNLYITNSSLLATDHKNNTFTSNAFIEFRGASSQSAPKKSYSFVLSNSFLSDYKSQSLLEMRADHKWILDSMYYDLSKSRNKTSMDLWFAITDFPHGHNKPENSNVIESQYVELFINNDYQGIYSLTQHIDAEILCFDNKDVDFHGVLYKTISDNSSFTPTEFINYRKYDNKSFYWDGFEQTFPDFTYWEPIYQLVKFVTDAEDNNFKYGIQHMIDIDNAVNYLLYVNLILGIDNINKNSYYIKPDENSKFYLCPWDMDRSWGRNVDQALPIGYDVWLSNNLFDRLLTTDSVSFKLKLKRKWALLRNSDFTADNLKNYFRENMNLLIRSGASARDAARWPDFNSDLSEELLYIENWIDLHLSYLDSYINTF